MVSIAGCIVLFNLSSHQFSLEGRRSLRLFERFLIAILQWSCGKNS
ncbi:hypothetical protein CKA32_000188 [Geitlerinema sp. FC II]|nr:hypothetical protein CKA32_000188 [Geitlerinema sp. FC II]